MKSGKLAPLLFVIALFFIIGIGYIYFFQISPTFVVKPEVEKPVIVDEITENHVLYLLNEMDAYKLHSDPLTKEPAVISVTVGDEDYTLQVDDNELKIIENGNPDIKISGNEEDILLLLESGDFDQDVVDSVISGEIQLDILADEKTLALKGYKSIYDKFSSNEITSNVVKLGVDTTLKGMNISLLFFFSLVLGLIIEKI